MKKTTICTLLLCLLASCILWGQSHESGKGEGSLPPRSEYAADELIIRFVDGTSEKEIADLRTELNAVEIGTSPLFNTRLWQLLGSGNIINSAGDTNKKAIVDDVGLNYVIGSTPMTLSQIVEFTGLSRYSPLGQCTQYPGTLTSNPGSQSVRIAVVDTGVEMEAHQDIFGPYVTETYNMINGSNNADDDNGHGTSVAGIITATLLSAGQADAQMLIYKALDENGSGDLFDAISAVEHAAMNNAQIINLSWGYSPAEEDEMTPIVESILQDISNMNVLFVASAGNYSVDIDDFPYYPAGLDQLDNLLSIGAADCPGQLADFSNFGLSNVDLLAPGEDILCPTLDGYWAYKSGTSFAAPIVAALATQYATQTDNWDAKQVVCRIFHSVEKDPELQPIIKSGGVLDTEFDPGSGACSLPLTGGYNTGSRAVFATPSQEEAVSVYPNPFVERIYLSFNSEVEGQGLLRLVDSQGRLVYHTGFTYTSGRQEIEVLLPVQQLASGMYTLQYQTGQQMRSLRLLHAK